MKAPVEDVESGARKGGGRGGARPGIVRAQREEIIRLIREEGAPPTTAAVVCGVPRRTHEDWLRRGRMAEGPEPCRRYADDVDAAVEAYKLSRIGTLEKAGEDDWRSAAFLLERRFPKEFGQRKQIDGQIQVQAVPLMDFDKLTADETEIWLALTRKAAPNQDDPALSETARPMLELVAGPEVIEQAE